MEACLLFIAVMTGLVVIAIPRIFDGIVRIIIARKVASASSATLMVVERLRPGDCEKSKDDEDIE